MIPSTNPERRTAIVCFVIFVAAAVTAILPFVAGMDMMQAGYALTCIAGFVAVSSAIAALMFFARAATWDRLTRGEDVLAHWIYDEQEWQAYSQVEFEEDSVEKRNLWLLVSGIALLVGVIFFIGDPQSGGIVLLVMLGLILVTGALAFGMPRLALARNRRSPGEAVISSNAVWLSGALHTWKGWGTKLESVRLREEAPAILEIVYSSPNRAGRQNTTVRVPVPRGQEKTARQVVEGLKDPAFLRDR
jgi:uncharacterized membrane protein YbaN (DUF454 family)